MKSLYAIFFLLTAPTFAQTVGGSSEMLHHWDGAAAYDGFANVSGAGDVNGDGYADLVVGATGADPGGLSSAGATYVYSGADGSLLYQWDGRANYDSFGTSVSGAGDVNGDGFDDVIVGASITDPGSMSAAGTAYVFSGADGSQLYFWNGGGTGYLFGSSVSGAGDVNGDGFADVIVGARGANPGGLSNAGSAFVYSGADGSLLHQWDGGTSGGRFGVSVSGATDINGDGFADLIVGADKDDPNGVVDAGSAYIYSGADGSLLHQFDGSATWDSFGVSVSGPGDMNGDGIADVIVGAHGASPGGITLAGSAFAYSGADGSLLHQWDGEASMNSFGSTVSGAGDVNGDGFADVIVGLIRNNGFGLHGAADIFSGADGSRLHQWDAEVGPSPSIIHVSGAGDVNFDGFADVIVGAIGVTPGGLMNAGSVYVYDFHPFLLASTPTISASAGGVLDLTLDFPDTAAFHHYITLMSVHGTGPINFGVDIPLDLDSYLIDSVAGLYPFSVTSNMQGTLDASGNAAASITFPAGVYNFAIGCTFWLAAVAFPTGQSPTFSSVAVAIEFVP